jgi:predicted RNA-binding protein with PUA-like domain
MQMTSQYWLFKSEPSSYSFKDLENDGQAEWDGVRNYQARNTLRDQVKNGDFVLFYHSNTDVPSVIGTARVVKEGYPDHTAWDPSSEHLDYKSSPDNPIWYMVDIAPETRFHKPVSLQTIRSTPKLADMVLVRKGMRLSIQPVTFAEFELIVALGCS